MVLVRKRDSNSDSNKASTEAQAQPRVENPFTLSQDAPREDEPQTIAIPTVHSGAFVSPGLEPPAREQAARLRSNSVETLPPVWTGSSSLVQFQAQWLALGARHRFFNLLKPFHLDQQLDWIDVGQQQQLLQATGAGLTPELEAEVSAEFRRYQHSDQLPLLVELWAALLWLPYRTLSPNGPVWSIPMQVLCWTLVALLLAASCALVYFHHFARICDVTTKTKKSDSVGWSHKTISLVQRTLHILIAFCWLLVLGCTTHTRGEATCQQLVLPIQQQQSCSRVIPSELVLGVLLCLTTLGLTPVMAVLGVGMVIILHATSPLWATWQLSPETWVSPASSLSVGHSLTLYGFLLALVILYAHFHRSSAKAFDLVCELEIASRLRLRRELEQDALLCSMLPASVLHRMMESETSDDSTFGFPSHGTPHNPQLHYIYDSTDQASVLFSDMVEFTKWSSQRSPAQVVSMLNSICIQFDAEAVELGVEKVKTIGDAYWAAVGLPLPDPHHADRLVAFAFCMLATLDEEKIRHPEWGDIQFRVGISSGVLQGAVLGTQRLSYEVFGPCNRGAEECEKHGKPRKVCISDSARQACTFVLQEGVSIVPYKVITVDDCDHYGAQLSPDENQQQEGDSLLSPQQDSSVQLYLLSQDKDDVGNLSMMSDGSPGFASGINLGDGRHASGPSIHKRMSKQVLNRGFSNASSARTGTTLSSTANTQAPNNNFNNADSHFAVSLAAAYSANFMVSQQFQSGAFTPEASPQEGPLNPPSVIHRASVSEGLLEVPQYLPSGHRRGSRGSVGSAAGSPNSPTSPASFMMPSLHLGPVALTHMKTMSSQQSGTFTMEPSMGMESFNSEARDNQISFRLPDAGQSPSQGETASFAVEHDNNRRVVNLEDIGGDRGDQPPRARGKGMTSVDSFLKMRRTLCTKLMADKRKAELLDRVGTGKKVTQATGGDDDDGGIGPRGASLLLEEGYEEDEEQEEEPGGPVEPSAAIVVVVEPIKSSDGLPPPQEGLNESSQPHSPHDHSILGRKRKLHRRRHRYMSLTFTSPTVEEHYFLFMFQQEPEVNDRIKAFFDPTGSHILYGALFFVLELISFVNAGFYHKPIPGDALTLLLLGILIANAVRIGAAISRRPSIILVGAAYVSLWLLLAGLARSAATSSEISVRSDVGNDVTAPFLVFSLALGSYSVSVLGSSWWVALLLHLLTLVLTVLLAQLAHPVWGAAPSFVADPGATTILLFGHTIFSVGIFYLLERRLRDLYVDLAVLLQYDEEAVHLKDAEDSLLADMVPPFLIQDLSAWMAGGQKVEDSISRLYPAMVVAFVKLENPASSDNMALSVQGTTSGKWMVPEHAAVDHVLKAFPWGVEKIKTIGSLVMLAGPFVPSLTALPKDADPSRIEEVEWSHAKAVATMLCALKTIAATTKISSCGVHCGEVMGAVQGTSRICFDLFGDTVNVASRVMSSALNTGYIAVSDDTLKILAKASVQKNLRAQFASTTNTQEQKQQQDRDEHRGTSPDHLVEESSQPISMDKNRNPSSASPAAAAAAAGDDPDLDQDGVLLMIAPTGTTSLTAASASAPPVDHHSSENPLDAGDDVWRLETAEKAMRTCTHLELAYDAPITPGCKGREDLKVHRLLDVSPVARNTDSNQE